ncbi:flagellar hook-associated protein FlgL [Leeia aquatica]|uniref:Flagellar hook-associated protein FlgL n=1 Tax=Leeia aquatica TaxID=2725557 RepID=A0A847S7R1_9NEIS|nr:flagellar hook-associated protein FlgL [Leeia aquatica]NLR75803.1 flagellar hook-associated protein FlgL [Leeia aquatica]
MRMSSLTMRELSVSNIQQRQLDLMQAQQQLGTGRRVLVPSDDPVAAARSLDVSQALGRTQQFNENGGRANSILALMETQLNGVMHGIQNLRELAVKAGNGGLSDANRKALAAEVEARFREMLNIANTRDADGLYMFSGYQGNVQPFNETASTTPVGTVAYAGDDGVRRIQISETREVQVSEAGNTVFGNLFATIKTLHDALYNGVNSPGYQTNLDTALNNLKTTQDNLGIVFGGVGTRENEIDATVSTGQDLALQYQTEHSKLVDIDYAKTISDYLQSNQLLEVARTTYQKTQGLSLFNYL